MLPSEVGHDMTNEQLSIVYIEPISAAASSVVTQIQACLGWPESSGSSIHQHPVIAKWSMVVPPLIVGND